MALSASRRLLDRLPYCLAVVVWPNVAFQKASSRCCCSGQVHSRNRLRVWKWKVINARLYTRSAAGKTHSLILFSSILSCSGSLLPLDFEVETTASLLVVSVKLFV